MHRSLWSPVGVLRTVVLGLILAAALVTSRQAAAVVTYDANTGIVGVQDGWGVWDTTTANWWNGTADVVWPNTTGTIAVFGGGSSGTAGQVSVGTVTAGGILFNLPFAGSYRLEGGTITLAGTTPTITVASATDTAEIASVIVGTGLNKVGAGTLILTAANTFTGPTQISRGTLAAGNVSALSSSSAVYVSTSSGSGTLRLATDTSVDPYAIACTSYYPGTIVSDRATPGPGITHALGAAAHYGNVCNFVKGANVTSGNAAISLASLAAWGTCTLNPTTADLVIVGPVSSGSGSSNGRLTLDGTSTASSILGVISDGPSSFFLTKSGAGTWTLSGANTYTGVTTLSGGILNVAALSNYDVPGSLGARPALFYEHSGSIGILFNGGTLQYTGSTAQSTNRQIRIGTAGGTIDASGSDPVATVSFTRTGANTDLFDSTGPRTLTLSGSNNGNNTFAISLTDEDASSGKTSLTKAGTGTWVLTSAATFSGDTRVTGGCLVLADPLALQNSTLDCSGGSISFGTLTAATIGGLKGSQPLALENASSEPLVLTLGSAISTYSGQLSGSGSLVKIGPGTTTLSGTNSYAGTTTVGGGVLSIAGTGSLPQWNMPGAFSVAGGTTLAVGNSVADGDIATLLGTGNFAASAKLGFDTSANDRIYPATLGDLVSGPLGFVKIGGNTLTLSGENTYTGSTMIAAGTLSVASINSVAGGRPSSNLGAPTTVANGTIAIGAGSVAGTLRYTGTGETTDRVINLAGIFGGVTIDQSGTGVLKFTSDLTATGAGSKTLTLQGSTAGSGEIAGAIVNRSSGYTTSLVKTGTGLWKVTGANAYTGGTTISGGTLCITTISDAGASSLGPSGGLTLNGGTLQYIGSSNATTVREVRFAAPSTVEVNDAGATFTFSGAVSGLSLTKTGPGTLALTGTQDNYSLILAVSTGTVELGKSVGGVRAAAGISSVAPGATVKLTGNGGDQIYGGNVEIFGTHNLDGTLDLAGHSESTSYFTGGSTGRVTSSVAGLATWTVGENDQWIIHNVFAGTIEDGAGTVALTKIGSGFLTLQGSNTHTGPTTVSAGALVVQTNNALGGTAGMTVVNSGGFLQLERSGDNLTISGETIRLSGGTLANTSGNNTWAGPVVVASNSSISVDADSLSITGPISGTYKLTKAGAGLLVLSGTNSHSGGTTLSAGTLSIAGQENIGGSAAPLTFSGGILRVTGTAITDLDSHAAGVNWSTFNGGIDVAEPGHTFIVSQNLGGTGKFTKAGAGTLILSGASTYTGGTTVTGGMLRVAAIADAGTSNIGPSGTVSVNGSTLQYTGGTATTARYASFYAGSLEIANAAATLTLAGTTYGTLTKTGPGTLALGGTADNSGLLLVVNQGTVELTKSAVGARAVAGIRSVAPGATVKLVGVNGDQIYGDTTTDHGVNNLDGTLDLAGHSESTSYFTGGPTGRVTSSVAGLATWTVGEDGGSSGAFAGAIEDGAGTVALTKIGSWVQRLSGASTYSGPTTVAGGALRIGGPAALSPNSNLALNGGVLELQNLNSFTRRLDSTAGAVQVPGGSSGFSAFGLPGGATVNMNNDGLPVQWGSPMFAPTALVLNAYSADSPVTFQNDLDLNGAVRTVNVVMSNAAAVATIGGNIMNTAGAPAGLIKSGGGVLALSGTNTYDGTTSVTTGTLRINGAAALSPNSNLSLNGGIVELHNPTSFTRSPGTAPGAVQIPGGNSGFSAFGLPDGATVNLNNGGLPIQWGSPTFAPTMLVLSAVGADSPLALQNDLDLNGAVRILNVVTSNAAAAATIGGSIVNTAGTAAGLTKTGLGVLVLAGTNTYDGTTTVSGGVLRINGAGALSPNSNLSVNSVVELQNPASFRRSLGATAGAVQVGGTNSGFSAFGVPGGAIVNLNDDGSTVKWNSTYFRPSVLVLNAATADSPLYLQNGLDLNLFNRTITVAATNAAAVATIGGNIIGATGSLASLTKNGPGTLVLGGANTYPGPTQIDAGTLRLTGSALSTSSITVAATGGATLDLARGGDLSALADTAAVTNNGLLKVSTAGQALGSLAGAGTTIVADGATLTADSIVQNTLTIGAGGSVTIRQAATADASSVPEPSTLVLLFAGTFVLLTSAWGRRRQVK